VAAGVSHFVPADEVRPEWKRLDLRGAMLATGSLGALVFAFARAQSAGWGSLQTVGLIAAGIAGLIVFAAAERRVEHPLLRVERLADRAIGGGFVMMLAAAAVLFGAFLLSSLYLQRVLGSGPLATGAGFLPFAAVTGLGVHAATHVIARRGIRLPLAAGFAAVAVGMALLSGVSGHGSYVADLLPGMLIACLGLGVVLVSVAFAVLSGAAPEEAGMLSGLNTTGHEVGGGLGVAILSTIATTGLPAGGRMASAAIANGLGNAFLAGAVIAGIAAVAALIVLPAARSFLPRLELSAPISIH